MDHNEGEGEERKQDPGQKGGKSVSMVTVECCALAGGVEPESPMRLVGSQDCAVDGLCYFRSDGVDVISQWANSVAVVPGLTTIPPFTASGLAGLQAHRGVIYDSQESSHGYDGFEARFKIVDRVARRENGYHVL